MAETISTINLTKAYGDIYAVDNLSLSIEKGQIYGFLGLNGAGKTTTIKMLLGMVTPTSGQCYIQGRKITRGDIGIWNDVGYIVEIPYSYPELTVRDNLELVSSLRGIEDKNSVEWVIDKMKLGEYVTKKAKNLSQGNAQRLGIAKAIIHRPKVLILDEPTNGLDPAGIVEVRELLMELAEEHGVTVLMSSHRLDEVSRIAASIGIIHKGKLIKEISGYQLEKHLKKSLLLDGRDRLAMETILTKAGYKISFKKEDSASYLQIHDEKAIKAPDMIARLLVNAGHPPTLLRVEREDLEMHFLSTIRDSGGDSE